MRKLIVFNNLSVDGLFVDRNGDMSWAKEGNDEEFNAFASENAKGGGALLFGRVTYEMMAGFWPTRQAIESFAIVAERMNAGPKIVFSRTLKKASWNNTKLIKGDMLAEIRKRRTMFDGIRENLRLRLAKSRVFRSGKVFLCYEPTA